MPLAEHLTERWLEPNELHLLSPVLESNGWAGLNPHSCLVDAVFDGDSLVGFFVLQTYPILGPMWVDPKLRGDGIPLAMTATMRSMLDEIKARGWLVIADSPHTEILCKLFGMRRVESPVYMV
jgi:hypothetical protein